MKTQVLPLNFTPSIEMTQTYNFKWNKTHIQYLGINIPCDLSKLYKNNYFLSQQLYKDMDWWDVLLLNLNQRIEIIKINVLSRVLYWFQSLPVIASKGMFKENENKVDSITKFTLEVWFKLVKKFKMEKGIKIFSWLAYDSKFKPGTMNTKFWDWASRGMSILSFFFYQKRRNDQLSKVVSRFWLAK